MRVSVPNIPVSLLNAVKYPQVSLDAAINKIAEFLSPGNATVLTGAGVSVDSGIRAYRGHNGRYLNPNYKPIFFHELMEDSPRGHSFRQRYWCRSYMGYPPVLLAQPNPSHYTIAAMLRTKYARNIITQNVDGLHLKALSLELDEEDPRVLQLHGSLHRVHCRKNHLEPRRVFQERLSKANPEWKVMADELERTNKQLRTNPDGDIELPGVNFDDFVIPYCETCLTEGTAENAMKPSVIFFGESIPTGIRDLSFQYIDSSDRLLVIGTTLATYSAFRLVKHAIEAKKPVLLLNVGPTRADSLEIVEKIELPSGDVLRGVMRTLFGNSVDAETERLLSNGVVTPPPEDDAVIPGSSR